MITNTGEKIIAKYLIGQAPAYASYIAVGSGRKPLAASSNLDDYSAVKNLTFETYRMQIISRGYVVEDGVSKVVLTAELPSEERYEITEIGIYPAVSNNIAANTDSRTLLKFSSSEAWTKNGISAIPLMSDKIATTISSTTGIAADMFRANADNAGLDTVYRISNYQRPRFLNEKIFIRGNTEDMISLSGTNLDLSQSSPDDEIRLAFSVLNNNETSTARPDSISIELKLKDASSKYATVTYSATHADGGVDFSSNRYIVASKKISDFVPDSGFDFKTISQIELSTTVNVTAPAEKQDFYVALDGLRLENTTSYNPLYGLVAYSPIVNADSGGNALPIIKQSSTSNLIEFRFRVGA